MSRRPDNSPEVVAELVASVDPFIWLHAGRYAEGCTMLRDDLVQTGRMLALRSARRFDDSFGVKFLSFAGPYIMRIMKTERRQLRAPVRIPRDTPVPVFALSLDADHGTAPQNIMEPDALELLFADPTTPREKMDEALTREAITAALGRLRPRHRRVITGRYLKHRTTRDIALEMGCSQQAVSQMEAEALRRLRFDDGIKKVRGIMPPKPVARLPKQFRSRRSTEGGQGCPPSMPVRS